MRIFLFVRSLLLKSCKNRCTSHNMECVNETDRNVILIGDKLWCFIASIVNDEESIFLCF